MLLTKESRSRLINRFIEQEIRDAKENDGVEVNLSCNLHNGYKGYTNCTDYELIQKALFWLFGEDFDFINEGKKDKK